MHGGTGPAGLRLQAPWWWLTELIRSCRHWVCPIGTSHIQAVQCAGSCWPPLLRVGRQVKQHCQTILLVFQGPLATCVWQSNLPKLCACPVEVVLLVKRDILLHCWALHIYSSNHDLQQAAGWCPFAPKHRALEHSQCRAPGHAQPTRPNPVKHKLASRTSIAASNSSAHGMHKSWLIHTRCTSLKARPPGSTADSASCALK
jgi:hypothetical protein